MHVGENVKVCVRVRMRASSACAHDDRDVAAAHLGHDAVVTRRHHTRRHLRNSKRNSLSLGCHENNLVPNLDAVCKPQKAWQHHLCTVANGVDCRVLDDDALVANQQKLEWLDHASQVRLVLCVVVP